MAKRPIPPLRGDRVCLRLLEESDLPRTLAWRNQDHIRRWFVHSQVITPEQHRQWFENYRDRDDDFVFVVLEARERDRPVGQVSLYRIDWTSLRAEFGRLMIAEPGATGRGLAHEATDLLIQYAVTTLGIRDIDLTVLAGNEAAIAIYTACGFRVQDRRDSLVHMSYADLRAAPSAGPTAG